MSVVPAIALLVLLLGYDAFGVFLIFIVPVALGGLASAGVFFTLKRSRTQSWWWFFCALVALNALIGGAIPSYFDELRWVFWLGHLALIAAVLWVVPDDARDRQSIVRWRLPRVIAAGLVPALVTSVTC